MLKGLLCQTKWKNFLRFCCVFQEKEPANLWASVLIKHVRSLLSVQQNLNKSGSQWQATLSVWDSQRKKGAQLLLHSAVSSFLLIKVACLRSESAFKPRTQRQQLDYPEAWLAQIAISRSLPHYHCWRSWTCVSPPPSALWLAFSTIWYVNLVSRLKRRLAYHVGILKSIDMVANGRGLRLCQLLENFFLSW